MILLCGIPSEGPLAAVGDSVRAAGEPCLMLNQRRVADWDLGYEVNDDGITGWITAEGRTVSLADVTGVYVRLMDCRDLPEYQCAPAGSPFRALCIARHDLLTRWLELTPARVLNRSTAMASNFSKPYQSQLIAAAGFRVPPTLVTSDPAAAAAFRQRHGRVIYKSISSTRSVVRELVDDDIARLGDIRWCPVQFQAFIDGFNVRVHVTGDRVFATAIESEAIDYRYARRETGTDVELRAFELPGDLGARCMALAHQLQLPLAGIDLKLAPDGLVYCFEVNPSPAFTYYEAHTGQPIARGIADYLCRATTMPAASEEPPSARRAGRYSRRR